VPRRSIGACPRARARLWPPDRVVSPLRRRPRGLHRDGAHERVRLGALVPPSPARRPADGRGARELQLRREPRGGLRTTRGVSGATVRQRIAPAITPARYAGWPHATHLAVATKARILNAAADL